MSRSIIMLLLSFGCFLLAVLAYSLGRGPHDFSDDQCGICHSGNDPASFDSLAAYSSSLACKVCHEDIFSSGFMHPVDIVPEKVSVPRDMPLSANGMLTCDTCHDVHGEYMLLGTSTNYLRRGEPPHVFCGACHTENQIGNSHSSSLAKAHFSSDHIAYGGGGEIDPMSKNCIGCHDGNQASSVAVNTGSWNHSSSFRGPGLGRKHPIGIHYEMARLRAGRKTDLRPMAEVDRRIVFFDGQVGCGSCHNPYGGGYNRLVMSNRRSALCFACHMLD